MDIPHIEWQIHFETSSKLFSCSITTNRDVFSTCRMPIEAYLRVCNLRGLPVIGTHVKDKSIDSGRLRQSNVGFPRINSVRIGISNNMVGTDIFCGTRTFSNGVSDRQCLRKWGNPKQKSSYAENRRWGNWVIHVNTRSEEKTVVKKNVLINGN